MTDLLKDNLILTKESKLGVSFLKLSDGAREKATLTDIEQGTEFHFESSYFESLLESGVFKVANQLEIAAFLGQLPKSESPQEIRDNTEQQRRLKYVRGAIDADIPSGTQHKLASYISIKSIELVDCDPPSAVTLYRWIRAYKRSGCDESSLIPRYRKAGNRLPKISNDHDELVTGFLNSTDRRLKIPAIYEGYLEVLEDLNLALRSDGKEEIKPITIQALRKRIRARKAHEL